MSRYLVTYHGGSGPPTDATQAEAIKQAFGQWLASAGNAVVDPGGPLRPAGQVATGDSFPTVPIGGFTIIQASNADEARAIVANHPFGARGGTLQLDEEVTI